MYQKGACFLLILKEKQIQNDLVVKKYLQYRKELSESEVRQLTYDEKGFEGEVTFERLLRTLPEDSLAIISDLLFEVNNSYAQADSLLFLEKKIILCEVKNMEGEHYYEGGRLFTLSGFELNNPFEQCDRTERLLKKKLHFIGVKVPIESYVIFVNPHFTLFQTPRNLTNLVLPSQINSFLQKIDKQVSTFSSSSHISHANKLLKHHQTENPFSRFPQYNYDSLKKGIYCNHCKSFSLNQINEMLYCATCKKEETIQNAVVRSTKEFQVLFPDLLITNRQVREWTKLELTDRQFRYTLGKHFKLQNHGRNSYYKNI